MSFCGQYLMRASFRRLFYSGVIFLSAGLVGWSGQASADIYTLQVPYSWKGNLHPSVRAVNIFCRIYRGDTSTHNSQGAIATKIHTDRHDSSGATAIMIFNNITGPVGSYACNLKVSKNSSGRPDEFLVTGTAREPWFKAGPGSVLRVRGNIQ